MMIGYRIFETYPVLFSECRTEAWWYVEGVGWQPLELWDLWHATHELSESEFEQMFGQLPPLPSTAFRTGVSDRPREAKLRQQLAAMYGSVLDSYPPEWKEALGLRPAPPITTTREELEAKLKANPRFRQAANAAEGVMSARSRSARCPSMG